MFGVLTVKSDILGCVVSSLLNSLLPPFLQFLGSTFGLSCRYSNFFLVILV
jgi:hypothetical protein